MLRIIPVLSRRAWLAALLLVWGWQGAYAQSPAPDPLPSWNDGAAKEAIVAFVDRVPGGEPVLLKEAEIEFVDDGPGKPVGINRSIGRRPIMAFGNSDGDLQMLQWTTAGEGVPLRPDRAPHRCGARMGVRPRQPHRAAR
jgi:hypothetical protein